MPFDLTLGTALLIMAGGLVGGFVNGLTGFGTGLSAMPVWLQVLAPPVAAQLASAGGVAGQLITFRSVWHAIDWRALVPMLAAGVIGVPLGAWLLPYVDATTFRRGIGVVLVAFSAAMLVGARATLPTIGGRAGDIAVGLLGGVLGGLAGLSGVVPTIWATLQQWSKDRRRGVFQAFNFTILSCTLLAHAAQGLLTRDFFLAFALALPGTFAGVALGQAAYTRLTDRGFDRVVLALLGIAGVALLLTST